MENTWPNMYIYIYTTIYSTVSTLVVVFNNNTEHHVMRPFQMHEMGEINAVGFAIKCFVYKNSPFTLFFVNKVSQ